MAKREPTARAKHRQEEQLRASRSEFLVHRFPTLKSLCVEYEYFDGAGESRNRQIKFIVNLERARSVFRLDCINDSCSGGDYDLSSAIARAAAAGKTEATGEVHCPGQLSESGDRSAPCKARVRYRLTMKYHPGQGGN